MADWTGSRIGRFFGRCVDWDTWQEGEDYPYVTGGSIELSAFSSTKVSGTCKFDGEAPDPSKLLRIYYEFQDAMGDKETRAVCTMLVEVANDDRTDSKTSGSAKLESVLKVLQDRQHGAPYVVPAGTNSVAKAVEICESLGLRTNGPTAGHVLSQQKVFTTDEANYLTIVNWLLSAAGYASATPDAYGNVVMEPYREPTERETVYRFEPGQKSVMLPQITVESDWQSSPNVVRLYFESDTESLSAYARNVDVESKPSLPNRNWREKTMSEAVTELAGSTPEERLENLEETARRKLVDNSAEVERVVIGCPYLPIEQDDSVSVDYAGVCWSGSVSNYKFDLGDDSSGPLTVRRFAKKALEIESGGEIIWRI